MSLGLITLVSTSRSATSVSRELAGNVASAFQDLGWCTAFLDWGRSSCRLPDDEDATAFRSSIDGAWGVVIATGIHHVAPASSCFAFLEEHGKALREKPVGLITAAGTLRSHLAISPLITSLSLALGAHIYHDTVQVSRGSSPSEIEPRVRRFARGFGDFAAALTTGQGALK